MVRAMLHTSHLLLLYWITLLLFFAPQLPGTISNLLDREPLPTDLCYIVRFLANFLAIILQIPANLSVLPPGLPPQVTLCLEPVF